MYWWTQKYLVIYLPKQIHWLQRSKIIMELQSRHLSSLILFTILCYYSESLSPLDNKKTMTHLKDENLIVTDVNTNHNKKEFPNFANSKSDNKNKGYEVDAAFYRESWTHHTFICRLRSSSISLCLRSCRDSYLTSCTDIVLKKSWGLSSYSSTSSSSK